MPARIAAMSSANAPGSMPWASGPITSAASISPVTVPDAGHAGVPGGGLGRLLHRNAEMPPLMATFPKWMCACWTVPSRPEYVSL